MQRVCSFCSMPVSDSFLSRTRSSRRQPPWPFFGATLGDKEVENQEYVKAGPQAVGTDCGPVFVFIVSNTPKESPQTMTHEASKKKPPA
jgi:hypothetical protein